MKNQALREKIQKSYDVAVAGFCRGACGLWHNYSPENVKLGIVCKRCADNCRAERIKLFWIAYKSGDMGTKKVGSIRRIRSMIKRLVKREKKTA